MTLVHRPSGSRNLRILNVVLLGLAACSPGEEPKKEPAATATPAPKSAKPAAPAEAKMDKQDAKAPEPMSILDPAGEGASATDEPEKKEYEEAVSRPLKANFPEETAATSRPAIPGLPANDPVLGSPLVIAGKVIPFDEVRRAVCLGGLGVAELERSKLRVYLQREIKRRLDAGATQDQVSFSEDEMKAVMKDAEDELKVEFPEGEVSMEDLFVGPEGLDPMDNLKLSRLFSKLFLPDNPADFPPATVDALLSREGGESVLEHYKLSYEARKGENWKRTVADNLLEESTLQEVLAYLNKTAVIERDPKPGVLYRVNDVDITVDQVWNRIKPAVTVTEVRFAKLWLVNMKLLEEALAKAGVLISKEEAETSFAAYAAPYENSLFSIEQVATTIDRFPSIEAYTEYWRLLESYKRMKAPEMTPEALAKHAEYRTNKVVGQVAVDVDVVLCSAFDFKNRRWKPNGWQDAENRVKDVLKLLIEEGRPWEELIEKYSDFYESPVPMSQRSQGMAMPLNKGRFRNAQFNNTLTLMGESAYTTFLTGSSITDFVFFDQEVGTLGDPMRGPLGWYLPRLIRRTKAPSRLSVEKDTMDSLIEEDYLIWHMNQWVQQLVHENAVYGIDNK